MPSSSFPVIPAGTKVTSGLLSSLESLNSWKTSATSVTSSVTPIVDPDLQITTTLASATYFFEGFLNLTGVLAAGVTLAVNYTGSKADSVWGAHGHTTGATTSFEAMGTTFSTTFQNFGLNGGNFDYLFLNGYLSTTSTGTVQIQWAQSVSNPTATVMRSGSWIRMYQVA